jgi:hypothetical protein
MRGAVLALTLVAATASAAEAPARKGCSDLSRACVIEVARTYLDARSDPRLLPFQRVAPKVQRWENGYHNATSAADIVKPAGPGPNPLVTASGLDRVFVDGNQAVFFWQIQRRDVAGGPVVGTAHITERFQVEAGRDTCGDGPSPCITQIEAVFCIAPGPEPELAPPPAEAPGMKILCNRAG